VKQRVIACVVVAGLLAPAVASAQEKSRLVSAVRKEASRLAQQSPAPERTSGNRLFWPGIVMLGAGGTLAALAATAAKKETCGVVSIGFDVIGGCVEETNKPLLWVGIGAAAGGGTLLAVGGSRHQVSVAPGAVRYRVRF
jgi:hypothetical protein